MRTAINILVSLFFDISTRLMFTGMADQLKISIFNGPIHISGRDQGNSAVVGKPD